MTIWIDADAAPLPVKEIVFRAAKRLDVQTRLVANQPMSKPPFHPMIEAIHVRQGANEADKYIVEHATQGDLVITADLPLAGELVEKGCSVIDPRGDEYSPHTIASRLSMRNFMDELRGTGMEIGNTAPYSEVDKKSFASTFDRLLTKALKRNG
jgi:uncharacterized protein YaiI (UPF0178 family)